MSENNVAIILSSCVAHYVFISEAAVAVAMQSSDQKPIEELAQFAVETLRASELMRYGTIHEQELLKDAKSAKDYASGVRSALFAAARNISDVVHTPTLLAGIPEETARVALDAAALALGHTRELMQKLNVENDRVG